MDSQILLCIFFSKFQKICIKKDSISSIKYSEFRIFTRYLSRETVLMYKFNSFPKRALGTRTKKNITVRGMR